MKVSFQTTNFNKANGVAFSKQATPESIANHKRIDRDDKICMALGTVAGATIGCLKYTQKVKAGVIGGLLGLLAGKIVGFFIHPRRTSP